jgi:thiol-disulfide isomerase/thioredoxin
MGVRKLGSGHGSVRIHRMGGTAVPVAILMIISFWVLMTLAGCSKPSSDIKTPPGSSYGEGSYEVIIFTDYFCPPCQALETELDAMLSKLLEKGDVKITFVDAPVSKHTQLYAKYFLYSINAGADFQGMLKTRRVLFGAARTNAVFTEEGIASELRGQGIAFQPYDLSKVYIVLNELMKNHDIRSTPTCVVKYPNSDVHKYLGPDDIKRGLSLLLSAQKHVK